MAPQKSDRGEVRVRERVSAKSRMTAEEGEIYLSGVQALVRVALDQVRSDRRNKLNTAMFIAGYRGSPLGIVDETFLKEQKLLDAHNIVFNNGLNEDLAATAVWGSQMMQAVPQHKFDGVLGMWYGKGPGVDRSGDALKHANYTGIGRNGGVLALAGDDPGCKSSSLPQQSEAMLYHLGMPTLYPSNIQDVIDLGLHGYAMSRATGLWSGFKIVTNVADGAGLAIVAPDRIRPIIPEVELDGKPFKPYLDMGINITKAAVEMERTLYNARLKLAREYIRVNKLDRIVVPAPDAWIGILTAGKTYHDVKEAFLSLGLDDEALKANGIRILKMAMITPVEPTVIREFARGLEELFVIEEKRPFLEVAVKDILYGTANAPRVIGKTDMQGNPVLPYHGELDAELIAIALQRRLVQKIPAERMRDRSGRIDEIKALAMPGEMSRSPYFCSGCPHNRSTHAPKDALVSTGIGCHTMAMWMDRGIVMGTHMGAEGAQWIGMAPFTEKQHIFQSIGDGTFFHSGLLALNYAVASGVNMTYKILYNSAVAMTGGQDAMGAVPVPALARELEAVGVKRIAVVTDDPEKYQQVDLPANASVRHRDDFIDVQNQLAAIPGVTAIIYDQQCAAEKRRLRGQKKMEEPARHIFINERVCEGCGDCQKKSNCLSVQAVETKFGRKTQIDQPSCNKDYSCVDGHCPSFLSVYQEDMSHAKKKQRLPTIDRPLPEPTVLVNGADFTAQILGIGGTGVVSVGAIVGAAAMSEGKYVATLDQTGLAQKGGPVMTNLKISDRPIDVSNSIGTGGADLYLAFDVLTGTHEKNLQRCDPERTVAIVSTGKVPTGMMVLDPRKTFPEIDKLLNSIRQVTRRTDNLYVDGQGLAEGLFADAIATNLLMVGVAYQRGLLPIKAESIEATIKANRSPELGLLAFNWGRMAVVDPEFVAAKIRELDSRPMIRPKVTLDAQLLIDSVSGASPQLKELLAIRVPELISFQNKAYAARYVDLVKRVLAVEQRQLPGTTTMAESVAKWFYKLMAFKDEYEVARLHVESIESRELQNRFGENIRVGFHLQPPILEYFGIKKKIFVGTWFVRVFRLIAWMKFLRWTPFDVFGYTRVRRVERELVSEYEALIESVLPRMTGLSHGDLVQLSALPDGIRGYDHVKFENLARYREQVHVIQARLALPDRLAA